MDNILDSMDAQEEVRKQPTIAMSPRPGLFGPDDPDEQDIIPEGDSEDSEDGFGEEE